ncbi:MAG: hypothetical protein RLZZ200_3125 [Pseudomonadota bacterium]
MSLGEFDLIDRYFRPLGQVPGRPRDGVRLGVGDDAALLAVPSGQLLVAALDSLVEGTHFLPGCDPASIGHRALAANLSDLAAMGAEPAWVLLGLTLPRAEEAFLSGFARGFGDLARRFGAVLVGGDTTSGPLSASVQVMGFVSPDSELRRGGGAAGDLVFVSGTPGDAAAGLCLERGPEGGLAVPRDSDDDGRYLRDRFLFPTPRVDLGLALRGLASACIDVSDGLVADAGKLAAASGCGLRLDVGSLPLSAALLAVAGLDRARRFALTGGEDYELCFSLPPSRLAELGDALERAGCAARCIGVLEPEAGLRVQLEGRDCGLPTAGFDHFRSAP